ncbi:hypothetical protein Ark11_0974 [Candidatus Ichthyocystis hellenicum]|uniref:Uncharacterized protein n=1 Tax=Candidatus Ichthyocystis hellenicum TaxID=1561003 RepID=A0A0S4M2E8_9BURK|nr:hypothetical protein [Candidatus Ichthyocystis hellenicum]CUT17793.1 hypothetical protein Ark11_0974 [Candidatus Ichthyocystis hellenicum]
MNFTTQYSDPITNENYQPESSETNVADEINMFIERVEREINYRTSSQPIINEEDIIEDLLCNFSSTNSFTVAIKDDGTQELPHVLDKKSLDDLDDIIGITCIDEDKSAPGINQDITDEDRIKIREIEEYLRCEGYDNTKPSYSSTNDNVENKKPHDLSLPWVKNLEPSENCHNCYSCYKYEDNDNRDKRITFLVTHDTKWEYGEIPLNTGTRINSIELESIGKILSENKIQEYDKLIKFLDYDTLVLIESIKERTAHACIRMIRRNIFNKIMKRQKKESNDLKISYELISLLSSGELRKNRKFYMKSSQRICCSYLNKNYSVCLKKRLSDIGIIGSKTKDEGHNNSLFKNLFISILCYTHFEVMKDIISKGNNYNKYQPYISDFLEDIKRNTPLWKKLKSDNSINQNMPDNQEIHDQLMPQKNKEISDCIAKDIVSVVVKKRNSILQRKPAAVINTITLYHRNKITKGEAIARIKKVLTAEYSDGVINRMVVETYNLNYSHKVLSFTNIGALPNACISIFNHAKKIIRSHIEKEPKIIFNLLAFDFITETKALSGPTGKLSFNPKKISRKIVKFYAKWIFNKYKLPIAISSDNLPYSEKNPKKIHHSIRIITADNFSNELVAEISKEIHKIINAIDSDFKEIAAKINNLGDCMTHLNIYSVKSLSAIILGQCAFKALKRLYKSEIHKNIVNILRNNKKSVVTIKKKLDRIDLSRCILYIIKSVNSVTWSKYDEYESIILSKICNYANISLEASVLSKIEKLQSAFNLESKNKSIYTVAKKTKELSYQEYPGPKKISIIISKLTNFVKSQVLPPEEFTNLLYEAIKDEYFFHGKRKKLLPFDRSEHAKRHILTIFDKCWTKNIKFFIRTYVLSVEKLKTEMESLLIPASKFTFTQECLANINNKLTKTTIRASKSSNSDESKSYELKNYGKTWICVESKLSKALNQVEISAANDIRKYFEERKSNFLSGKILHFTANKTIRQINIVNEVNSAVSSWTNEIPETNYNSYEVDRILSNLSKSTDICSFVLHSDIMRYFLGDSKSFLCFELTKEILRIKNVIAYITKKNIVRETYMLFCSRFRVSIYENSDEIKRLIGEESKKIESLPLLDAIRSIVNLERRNLEDVDDYFKSAFSQKEYYDIEKSPHNFDVKVEEFIKKMNVTSPSFHVLLKRSIKSILVFINNNFKSDMHKIRKNGIDHYLQHCKTKSIKNLCEIIFKDVFMYNTSNGKIYKKIYSLLDICAFNGWTLSKKCRMEATFYIFDIIAEEIAREFNRKILPEELDSIANNLARKKVLRETKTSMDSIFYVWKEVIKKNIKEYKISAEERYLQNPLFLKIMLKNHVLELNQVSITRDVIVSKLSGLYHISNPDYELSNFDEIDKICIIRALEARLDRIIETEIENNIIRPNSK